MLVYFRHGGDEGVSCHILSFENKSDQVLSISIINPYLKFIIFYFFESIYSQPSFSLSQTSLFALEGRVGNEDRSLNTGGRQTSQEMGLPSYIQGNTQNTRRKQPGTWSVQPHTRYLAQVVDNYLNFKNFEKTTNK